MDSDSSYVPSDDEHLEASDVSYDGATELDERHALGLQTDPEDYGFGEEDDGSASEDIFEDDQEALMLLERMGQATAGAGAGAEPFQLLRCAFYFRPSPLPGARARKQPPFASSREGRSRCRPLPISTAF